MGVGTCNKLYGVLVLLTLLQVHASWPSKLTREGAISGKVHSDVPASFDCAQRKLAYQFGKQLIPRMGSFEALYYALDLNSQDCHVEYEDTLEPPSPEPAPALPKDALFVHPTLGDDSANGSQGAPLRSIQAALDMAGARDPTPAVVLREGTHYLQDTLHLSSEHSGLHMMGYPGETSVVSGGIELTGLQWKPYNVTSGDEWVVEQNQNAVYGQAIDNKTFILLGKFAAADQCQLTCDADPRCNIFTWHDANQGSYAEQCWGRSDHSWSPRAESGHVSGFKTPPKNIWVAHTADQVSEMDGLQVNGVRATVARYPNLPAGIESSCGYGCMLASGSASWTPPNSSKYGKVVYYTDSNPAHDRNDTANGWFHHYMIGVGGLCSVYDPPVSYWCSEHPSGGGAFAFRTPSGVSVDPTTIPKLPYWKNPEKARWFVWRPARWANWMFDTGSVSDAGQGGKKFDFGTGGNQGARGSNNGGDYFVQNVFEELDNPGEFYFDSDASMLYLWHNGTGAPSTSGVVVPHKQVLLNVTGSQWSPVTDIKLTNIKYTAAAATYMERHGVPSAGDWALDRFAAVFFQGTEGAVIDGCTFDRLDGNAVMISGYNRNTTVKHSDFSFIGGNAIASWGYTNETDFDPGRPGIILANAPAAGVDGTDGEHPRYNQIISNTAREVGLYEKQSSFYVQAKTAQSTIHGNCFFNGPRAGVNANDGFGGGDEISNNLVFSTCRESGDHGPFNSWDRQPFLTTVRDGSPSMTPAYREIHHNFFIDNYSPQENVDNDDGSSYYNTHHNFFVYGGNGMKNDFGGHDNIHHNNVYAYVGQAIGFYDAPMLDGHQDTFSSNRVVMTGSNVGSETCKGAGTTVMGNNTYYTADGSVTECGKSLEEAQKEGIDLGSTVEKLPKDSTIIDWASQLLGIPN